MPRIGSSVKPILLLATVALSLVGNQVFGSFTTLVDNGPSANRVDVVFLGDGYTTADLAAGTYDDHIDGYLDHMFSNTLNSDPFYRYRNFFNVHSIEVVSNEAGADIPPDGIFRDTALDASYYFNGSTERLLSVKTSKANAARNAGLVGAGFSAEMQYVTVNDTKYGGAGGSYAVYAGGNSSAAEVALHEVAHSFSDSADEYGGAAGPYTGSEPSEYNVTKDPTGAKWSHWLGHSQLGIGTIGAYEGARYYNTGLYRPSSNSKMRSLNKPFDAITREKIILDVYDFVDPFDDWLDNSVPLIDPGELFVDRIDDGVIDVEWFVDSGLVPAASGDTFDLTEFGYGAGDYVVSARGFDPTGFDPIDGWVRINQNELEQFVSWDITISEPETGDFNGDLFVDGLDFLQWQRGDSPNSFSASDLAIWEANFGTTVPLSAISTAVPEPATGIMLLFGTFALFFRPDVNYWGLGSAPGFFRTGNLVSR